MIDIRENLNMLVEKVMEIKPGQNLLIIADNYARPKFIGQIFMELAISFGANATYVVMEPPTHVGDEPQESHVFGDEAPKPIARAMKEVDVILNIVEKFDLLHSNATKEATEAGVKFFVTYTELSEDYFKRKISFEDLKVIRERTNKLSKMLTEANIARLTTSHGTSLTMNIKGRQGLTCHPFGDADISAIPDFAESLISPNEGGTEGLVVADSSVMGWGLLKEPLRFSVKKGRVEEVMGETEDSKKFRKLISMDENSNNCAAELGIGTRHTGPNNLRGGVSDYTLMGTVHIAVGRNADIGGTTWSKIHNDLLMTQPTVELDGVRILENGRFQV